jgi:hypothetical protein
MENEIPAEAPIVLVPEALSKRRPFHLNKWYVVTAVLIIVIVIQGFLYLNLNSSYYSLNENQ